VHVRPDHEDPGAEPGPELHQEDRADTERAAEERRGEGADQRPATDRCREQSDLEAGKPLAPPSDDDHKQNGRNLEVANPVEERGGP